MLRAIPSSNGSPSAIGAIKASMVWPNDTVFAQNNSVSNSGFSCSERKPECRHFDYP